MFSKKENWECQNKRPKPSISGFISFNNIGFDSNQFKLDMAFEGTNEKNQVFWKFFATLFFKFNAQNLIFHSLITYNFDA